ncbi:hypothetical protein E3N88_41278 [Mikania micrantha]|uniref:Uncharacterized protein n=1 Tax=Mikania micrantha TaxID=192012 RepID=A0A5N6LQY5_9ASTR|nr:hypothetical protein E3N88_41278 [Mikania micrantha]
MDMEQITREIGISIPSIFTFTSIEICRLLIQVLNLFRDSSILPSGHIASTMGILMLVMMVFTRTRHEESTKIPANQPVSNGSGHVAAKRRRKHKSLNIAEAAEQHVVVEEQAASQGQADGEQPADDLPDIEQPTVELPLAQQRSDPPKRRGTSATHFATECGIVIRNVCPMNYHTWDSVPSDVKTFMYEKLEGRFELLRPDNIFMEYVNTRLRAQWKCTRGVLSQHWKMNGGKTNPTVARSKMKPDCRSEEDWNSLCDYWESEKTRQGPQPQAKAEETPWGRRGAKIDQEGATTVHTRAALGSASASPCTAGAA